MSNGAPITSYNVEVAGCKNISFDVTESEKLEDDEEEETREQQVQEYSIEDLKPSTLYRYGSAISRITSKITTATTTAGTRTRTATATEAATNTAAATEAVTRTTAIAATAKDN